MKTLPRLLSSDGPVTFEEIPIDLVANRVVACIYSDLIEQAQHSSRRLVAIPIKHIPDLYWDVAAAYQARGYHGHAYNMFRNLAKEHQFLPTVWARMAECCRDKENASEQELKDAVDLYLRFLEMENNVDVRVDLSRLYSRLGEKEKGKEVLPDVGDYDRGPVNNVDQVLKLIHVSLRERTHTFPITQEGFVKISDILALPSVLCLAITPDHMLQLMTEDETFSVHMHDDIAYIKARVREKKRRRGKPVIAGHETVNKLAVQTEDDLTLLMARSEFYKDPSDTKDFLDDVLPCIKASLAALDVTVYEAPENVVEEEDEEDTNILEMPKKKRKLAKKKQKVTAAHPARKLLGRLEFICILHRVFDALSKAGRVKEACEVVQQIDGWGNTHKSVVPVDNKEALEILEKMRMVAASIAFEAGNYNAAYKFIRYVVHQRPHSAVDIHLLNRILFKLQFHNKCVRYNMRMLQKYPNSVPLRVLTGHGYLVHRNFDQALDHYLKAMQDEKFKNHPTLHFFIGVTAIQQAMLKRTRDRHLSLLRGFAYMWKYYELREGDAESCFNLARALHYIGLTYLSRIFYDKCHARMMHGETELKREAAHNLATIYLSSGSRELARRLYIEYATI